MHYDCNLEAINRLKAEKKKEIVAKEKDTRTAEEEAQRRRVVEITGIQSMLIIEGSQEENQDNTQQLNQEVEVIEREIQSVESTAPTEPSADITQISNMVDYAKTQQLKDLMDIQNDKDLDPLNHQSKTANQVPTTLEQDEEMSDAISLTDVSIQSENSTYSDFSSTSI